MNIAIDKNNLEIETTLEIIKFLSKTVGSTLDEKAHKDLNQVIAWSGCCSNKEDEIFFITSLKELNKKIDEHFQNERKNRHPNLIFTKI